jgi:ADP-ribose pyrophosphatase
MIHRTAPWRVLQSVYSFKDQWVAVRSETVELPDGTVLSPYHTLEFPDWVCAVAVTPDLEIVLVEQYRHGAKRPMTELPAGAVEAGEEPLRAMQRELLEETGFVSDSWVHLATYPVNGARHTNKVHAFLALNAHAAGPQRPDIGELLVVHKLPWNDFKTGLDQGKLTFAACQLACLFKLQTLVHGQPENRQLKELAL